jgi:hypothetical protein
MTIPTPLPNSILTYPPNDFALSKRHQEFLSEETLPLQGEGAVT